MITVKQLLQEFHTPEQLDKAEEKHSYGLKRASNKAERLRVNIEKVREVERQSTAKKMDKKFFYTNTFTKQRNSALHKANQHKKALKAIDNLRHPKPKQSPQQEIPKPIERREEEPRQQQQAPKKKPGFFQTLRYAWSH